MILGMASDSTTDMHSERATLDVTEITSEFEAAFEQVEDADVHPTTLGDIVDIYDQMMAAEDVLVTVDEMSQSESTRHQLRVAERTEYHPCVLDALVTAFIIDESPVDITSESPIRGDAVSLTVEYGSVEATPDTATFSIGIQPADLETSVTKLNQENSVLSSCAYINAFPDASAFDEWRAQLSDGIVMRLDTDEMVSLARYLAGEFVVPERT